MTDIQRRWGRGDEQSCPGHWCRNQAHSGRYEPQASNMGL